MQTRLDRTPISVFRGRNAHDAKRRALNYWYQHRRQLDLSLAEFFARCRVSHGRSSTTITLYDAEDWRAA